MIQFYPFGHQNCSFSFFSEQSGKLVPGIVSYLGSSQTGEYQIDSWNLTCSKITRGQECINCEVIFEGTCNANSRRFFQDISVCIATVTLTRNILSVSTVTFLPPFLMNIINQVYWKSYLSSAKTNSLL